MCEEHSLSLQNILQSVPRREPRIILERAEYVFPALKNSLVSFFFMFVQIEQKLINVYIQKTIFGNILPLNIPPNLFNYVITLYLKQFVI